MNDNWFDKKFGLLKNLGYFAIAGVICLCVGYIAESGFWEATLLLSGLLLFLPWLLLMFLMTVWHWKYRYRGDHSDLWGALLLLETSGWFKVVYWLRHILPDRRGTGRYTRTAGSSTTND